jgi:hypothetical protein
VIRKRSIAVLVLGFAGLLFAGQLVLYADGPVASDDDKPPAAVESQVRAADDQMQLVPVSAPGSDATVFVPGSSLEYFGQVGYFRLGSLLLRPSGRVTYVWESNVFSAATPKLKDQSVIVEPAIEGFLPISRNGIRFDYATAYRGFRNFELRHHYSHSFNADSKFDISPILSISVRDHYALSTLDAREYVPGREVIFSDAQFRRNDAEVQMDWAAGANNNFGLRSQWNHVAFDAGPVDLTRPFYDYDEYRAGTYFRRDVTQRTAFYVDGNFMRYLADDPRHIASSSGYETVGGMETQLTPITSAQFSVGFRSLSFEKARSQRFRGAIYRGSLQKEFSERIRIALAVARGTNPSNYQLNPYYVTTGVGVTYFHELTRRVLFSLTPGYQRNTYPLEIVPEPGVPPDIVGRRRWDRIFDLAAVVRYNMGAWAAADFRFDTIRRKSVVPEFTFNDYRFIVTLVIGYRGTIRGHLPD